VADAEAAARAFVADGLLHRFWRSLRPNDQVFAADASEALSLLRHRSWLQGVPPASQIDRQFAVELWDTRRMWKKDYSPRPLYIESLPDSPIEVEAYKVTLLETVDVRGLRKRLHLSQGRFADNFGLSVDAVRHWESGRRQPEAAARALLIVIAADPEFVMRSLATSA